MIEEQLPVGIDVDECCLDLLSGCCEFFNEQVSKVAREIKAGEVVKLGERVLDHTRLILPEDLSGWDLVPYFGEGWQRWLAGPEFYKRYVRPVSGARRGVEKLRAQGERVVFVSYCVRGSANQKQQSLIDWGFFNHKDADPEKDFIGIRDKKLVRLKALFDDGIHNVENYPGPAFLVNHWHNRGLDCSRDRVDGIFNAAETLRKAGLSPIRLPATT